MDRRRIPVPLEMSRRLKNGEPLRKLAKEYKVPQTTLRDRLIREIGKQEYDEIIERVKPLKWRTPLRYGSPEAKRRGADSRIELEVMEILKKHGMRFKCHEKIEVKGHWYEADFILDHVIIEVTGLNTIHYWEHYKKKLKNYIESGYRVILTMPKYIHKIATKYLPKHGIKVINIKDFDGKFEETLEQMNRTAQQHNFNDKKHISLKKAPSEGKKQTSQRATTRDVNRRNLEENKEERLLFPSLAFVHLSQLPPAPHREHVRSVKDNQTVRVCSNLHGTL